MARINQELKQFTSTHRESVQIWIVTLITGVPVPPISLNLFFTRSGPLERCENLGSNPRLPGFHCLSSSLAELPLSELPTC